MYQLFVNDPHFLPHAGCQLELTFQKGEFVTLVGENGVGKTSLAHRFYQENAQQVALVAQKSLDYFYDRTLGKIKSIYLAALENEEERRIFLLYWEAFGLYKKENRLHSSLSGGEGQALKLCLGLAAPRELYLLDEPGQHLDREAKNTLADILKEIISQKKTIVMIEHNLDWIKLPMQIYSLEIKNEVLQRGRSWTI